MKNIITLLAFAFSILTVNAESLHEWISKQDTRDSITLNNMAVSKPCISAIISVTTNTVHRPSELVAKEQAHVALMAALGLPATGTNEEIQSALEALKQVNFAAAAELGLSLLNVRVYLGDYREGCGMSRAATYTDPHFGQESYEVVIQTSTPVYGPSIAESNGWGVVTVAMIEEAQR